MEIESRESEEARETGEPRKILFISQQCPYPLNDGGNIRSFKILEALAGLYAITLICSLKSDVSEGEARNALGPLCRKLIFVPDEKSSGPAFLLRRILRSMRLRIPLSVAYNYNRHLEAGIALELRNQETPGFRFVHYNHSDTVQYSRLLNGTPGVVDTHNLLCLYYEKSRSALSNPLKKWIYGREARMHAEYERKVFQEIGHVIVCSRQEKDWLATRLPVLAEKNSESQKVSVIPNGVDGTYYDNAGFDYFENPNRIAFTGNMGYFPNHDAALFFAQEVMPILRAMVPGVEFYIIGKSPDAGLKKLASRYSDIKVTGEVPDVRAYVRQCKAFVAPIRHGAGTRLKILEAFSLGIPVLSTSIGAEGIEYTQGENILLADDPAGLAQETARLLRDEALHRKISAGALDLASSRYDWSVIGGALRQCYEDMARKGGPRKHA